MVHSPDSSLSSAPILLRARIVLPVAGPLIENGAVLVAGNQIASVGPWSAVRSKTQASATDLGEVILLPGLINAHCHLDYTGMAGQIASPSSFSDWIKALLALKAHWTYSDFSLSWLQGARMLLAHGATTVADIEAVPELLPEVRTATPLRVCSLLEMTGVRRRRVPRQVLNEALERIHALPPGANWAGLSPHAPYSTTPELLRLSALTARQRGWLVATHVSESSEEFDMFVHGTGPMFEWLKGQRDTADCGKGSPIAHLERQGLLAENLLAIHANYLAPGDADLLGQAGASVVHCPRSHEYFGHAPFPRAELAKAGVNLCLGTDSLASVRSAPGEKVELDLRAEMRVFSQREPSLSPDAVLELVTIRAAEALGMAGKLGQLSEGALADLIVIPFDRAAREASEALIQHKGPVSGAMIDGRWVLGPSSL